MLDIPGKSIFSTSLYAKMFNSTPNVKIQPQSSTIIASNMNVTNEPYQYNNAGFRAFAGNPVAITQDGKVVGGISYMINSKTIILDAIEVINKGKVVGTKTIQLLFEQNPNATAIKGEVGNDSRRFWGKLGAKFDGKDQSQFIIKREGLGCRVIG